MSLATIKALSFDAAGTLIELAEPVGDSYSRVAKRHGIQSEPDQLTTAFATVWRQTPSAFASDSPVKDSNEKSWWRRLVKDVFREAGATIHSDGMFDAFFEDLYNHFEEPGTWTAIPEAKEALPVLAENLPCIVLSNFDARLRRILSDLELIKHFDTILLSCELGASKPDPKVFRAALEALDLPAESILHIGDDPVCDWKGAKDAGFQYFPVGKGQPSLRELLRQLSLA